jgi:YD repeat-containing protein
MERLFAPKRFAALLPLVALLLLAGSDAAAQCPATTTVTQITQFVPQTPQETTQVVVSITGTNPICGTQGNPCWVSASIEVDGVTIGGGSAQTPSGEGSFAANVGCYAAGPHLVKTTWSCSYATATGSPRIETLTFPEPDTRCGVVYPPCDPNDASSPCFVPDKPNEVCDINKECKTCLGSPCYVATGAYETAAVDLSIPTNGFPLVLARIYNSSHQIDGPLGPGWTSSLDARLFYASWRLGLPDNSQTASRNEAVVVLPDGTHRTFPAPAPPLDLAQPVVFGSPTGRHDRLVRNPDGTWDLEIQHSLSVYRFGAEGRLVTMTDDFGNTLRWTYDGAGRIMRVADESGSGRSLDVYWGPNGRIADVQDNAGRVVHYDYDAAGMLVRVVDPESRNTHYTYTPGRFAPVLALVRDHWNRTVTFMTWETHPDGRPTGRLRSYMDEGEVYTYAYEAGASVKTDSAGRTWRFPFRADDLITERQAPGGTESTVYDGAGRVLQSTDPVGVVTQYQWNASGTLASVTQAAGTQEAVRFDYSYDANYPWKVTAVVPKDPNTSAVDRDWQESRYAFHPPGSAAPGALWKVIRVRADGTPDTLTTYEYDVKGRVTRVLDALGHATDYAYDAAGNLLTVTRPANDDLGTRPVVTYGYDALGRVTTITEGQAVTTVAYDAVDRVVATSVAKNGSCLPDEVCNFTTNVSYDNFDATSGELRVHQTDANGIVTRQGYDAFGRLVASVDAESNATRYGYERKLLVSITDAHDYTTQYAYDPATGRLDRTIFPDGAVESYGYYADGQLGWKLDRMSLASQVVRFS